jgi:filamentous hemagglutinin
VQRQLKILIGLWEFIALTAFPIHLLDDENRKLVNPIVDASGLNPTSGGYAEGGGVITTPHTGGTQLDGVQKDGAYVTPEHKLNPGVMYTINGITPRNARNLVGGPLEGGTQVSRNFILEGGPVNGVLYRADNQGNINSYATYDSVGMVLKRVDVTGKPHLSVPTPHVIEYGRNTLPDGTVRVQSPSTKLAPRPIRPDEVP